MRVPPHDAGVEGDTVEKEVPGRDIPRHRELYKLKNVGIVSWMDGNHLGCGYNIT